MISYIGKCYVMRDVWCAKVWLLLYSSEGWNSSSSNKKRGRFPEHTFTMKESYTVKGDYWGSMILINSTIGGGFF